MKIQKSKSRRLAHRSKFLVLAQEFIKEGEKCSWNLLRSGETVEIDAKALLSGNGLEVPSGHSVSSFVEVELGVDVLKSTKAEDKIVGAGKEEIVEQQQETPESDSVPDDIHLTEGGEN